MELVFLLLLLVFTLIFLRETYTYQVPSFDTSGGPALFPQYVLVLLAVCIVVLMIQLIWKKQGRTFVFFELFKGERGVFLLALVLYVLLLTPIGFLLSTMLFLIFTINYLTVKYNHSLGSVRHIIIRSGIALAISLAVNNLFTNVFRVILPRGIIF